MKFNNELVDLKPLVQINQESGRTYRTPEGNTYPSITTVLSGSKSGDYLKEWRERVGEEEADKISKRARDRGTDLHKVCEDYLSGNELDLSKATTRRNFHQIQKFLNKIDKIKGIEIALYSEKLRIAGTADCIAYYDGTLCVIDYKTSRMLKREEWITDYYLQGAFYAIAFYEMYGSFPKYVKIIMATDDLNPYVFSRPVKEFLPELIKRRKVYKDKFSI